MRAFWMAQELLTTFEDTATLQAVTLIPSTISGRFLVQSFASDGTMSSSKQLWDRTSDDGFPEMKVLKQLVRDEIDPNRFLGHSDRDETKLDTLKAAASTPKDMESQYSLPHIDEIIPPVFATKATLPSSDHPDDETNAKNDIVLLYCTGCRWLLRAAYFAQELLATFNDQELRSVTLVPSRPPANPGGTFVIQLEMAVDNDGQVYDNNSMPKQSISSLLLWDRSEQNRFPDIKELKQLVRDQLNPSKDLGHSETARPTTLQEEENESMDEKSAQKARDFFGVS